MQRKQSLFSGLERIAAIAHEAADLLGEILSDIDRVPALSARIRDLEHLADGEARRVFETLRRRLTSGLDDVVDTIEEAAARLHLYRIETVPEEVRALGHVLRLACDRMAEAVEGLRHMHTAAPGLASCRAIGIHEREADRLQRAFLARLFKDERDVFTVLKWTEISGLLEATTDRVDDVANIVEGIVIEEL
jgi:uncharacterized protein Yka (UPF0111/DUF47 family)